MVCLLNLILCSHWAQEDHCSWCCFWVDLYMVNQAEISQKDQPHSNQRWTPALTSEFGGCSAVRRGLPSVLVLFKLLHPAQVEAPVPLGHVQDEQVKHLPLLHNRQLHFGAQETLCVVAVKAGLPHVDAGDEELVLGLLCPRRQETPLHHWQGGIASSLGHDAGERDVLTLLRHREGWWSDGDIDSQTNIWGGNNHLLLIYTQQLGEVCSVVVSSDWSVMPELIL